jgi:XapX domain-containing protein
MKMYVVSLGVGILVGIIYSLVHVRSPAPPLVALVGLLGMLAGERAIPVSKQLLFDVAIASAWRQADPVPQQSGSSAMRSAVKGSERPYKEERS